MAAILAMPGIIEALIAVIGTLIGALVGFMLSEWGTSRRENRNEKKEAQASKAIISLEIDLNLEFLQDLWQQVVIVGPNEPQDKDEKINQKKRKIIFAKHFIEAPVPEWSREVFVSQLPLIATALGHQEVVKVFQFYDRLRRLETIRNDLISAHEAQRAENRAAVDSKGSGIVSTRYAYTPPAPFDSKAIAVWNECESLVAQLISKDNPLKPQK